MQFPPAVERWRSTVAKYFPPELVDKALYVIQGESGGDPNAVGDGGSARGLFQIQDSRNFSSRPDAAFLDNPENNIAYAAQQLGAAGGNWSAWGEGTTFNGKPFGALGNNPYPGDGGGTSMPSSDWYTRYAAVYNRWAPLSDKYAATQGLGGAVTYVPGVGLVAGAQEVTDPTTGSSTVDPATGTVMMTEQEYNDFMSLDRQLGDLETEYEKDGGGNLDDAIKRATFDYNTDPRNIDAQNAANKFSREMDVRHEAAGIAADRLSQQQADQKDAVKSFNDFISGPSWGQTFMAPSTNLPTADDLFRQAVDTVKKGLPDVPDAPYYSDAARAAGSGSMPSIAGIRSGLDSERGKTSGGSFAGRIFGPISAAVNAAKNAPAAKPTSRASFIDADLSANRNRAPKVPTIPGTKPLPNLASATTIPWISRAQNLGRSSPSPSTSVAAPSAPTPLNPVPNLPGVGNYGLGARIRGSVLFGR